MSPSVVRGSVFCSLTTSTLERRGRRLLREREPQAAAIAWNVFDPDRAAMVGDDPRADRQPDAASGTVSVMEPAEHGEDLLAVIGIDADAVVGHFDEPLVTARLGSEGHLGRDP